MKTLAILTFTILLLGCLSFSKFGADAVLSGSPEFRSPTPSPSLGVPTNKGTPSNSKGHPPTAEQLAEIRQKLEPLFAAKYPLTAEALVDVDGDGKKDKVFYRAQPWENDFEGQLKITSAEGRTLWEDNFPMGSNDLAEFLTLLGYDSIREWVKNVFNKKQNYSFQTEALKIRARDIEDDQLAYASKVFKFSERRIKKEILHQRINRRYSYRAEWREDLMRLVYVPSIKRFICYSRGY